MATVKYRGYEITEEWVSKPERRATDFSWVHEGFDGPGDDRYGHAASVEACKEAIDEKIAEDEE